ncbi:hypothetical protein FOA52_004047 [Chlamydomonas sp. UWO 241]|nr:hypothetical protein FOA52_004047 [Chlamydomonas sp. UWO 241]
MGNAASSAADRAVDAAKSNNLKELREMITCLSELPDERREVLSSCDAEGRSCLILAAMHGHYAVAQMLLQYGADAAYLNKASKSAGTALHEATARRNEKMVELLLTYGANPFQANSEGVTPIETAVIENAPKVFKRFERMALFSGEVRMMWTKMAGYSHLYKPRHVIVMDHFGPPGPDGRPSPPRRQMWVHADNATLMPRCRLWLDGAVAYRVGPNASEAILRLHPEHATPTGVFTRSVEGVCIVMANPVAASARWAQLLSLCSLADDVTVPNLAPWLIKGSAATPMPSGALPPRRGSSSRLSASGSATPLPRGPPSHTSSASSGPVRLQTSHSVGAGAASPTAAAAAIVRVGSAPVARAATAPGARAPAASPAQSPARGHAPLAASTAAVTAATTPPAPGWPAGGDSPPAGHSGGDARVAGSPGAHSTGPAAPGHNYDDDLAALAAATAVSGSDILAGCLDTRFGAAASRIANDDATGGARAALARAGAPAAGAAVWPAPGGGAHGGGGGEAGPTTPGRHVHSHGGETSMSAQPAHNANTTVGAGRRGTRDIAAMPGESDEAFAARLATLSLSALSAGGAELGGMATARPSTAAAAAYDAVPDACKQPSAPPASSADFKAASAPPVDDVQCVICLSAPREAGFLHGATVHRCVCRACSQLISVGRPCPLCRQPVERVLGIF